MRRCLIVAAAFVVVPSAVSAQPCRQPRTDNIAIVRLVASATGQVGVILSGNAQWCSNTRVVVRSPSREMTYAPEGAELRKPVMALDPLCIVNCTTPRLPEINHVHVVPFESLSARNNRFMACQRFDPRSLGRLPSDYLGDRREKWWACEVSP